MRTLVAWVMLGLAFSPSMAAHGKTLHDMEHGASPAVLDPKVGSPVVKPLPDPGVPRPRITRDTGWSNSGGNSLRNGLSPVTGPTFFDPLWTNREYSYISWQPLIDGRRVFTVRQAGSPGSPSDSPVVAMSLDTGAELWRIDVPARPQDNITSVLGAQGGRVYATRAGLDNTPEAPLYALDAASGATVWVSAEEISAGPYEGMVFTQGGDPLVESETDVRRIRASDGTTAWSHPRVCYNNYGCGLAAARDAIYFIEFADGLRLVRIDANTGVERYRSPAFAYDNPNDSPMIGLDGSVYLSDSGTFYAFADNGVSLSVKWTAPVTFTVLSESAVGPDGSVYTLGPGPAVVRLDPRTGATVDSFAAIPIPNGIVFGTRFAIDAAGTVYFSTGGGYDARLFAFTKDLEPLWDFPLILPNVGGPALGPDGTLVVGDVGSVFAFRPDPCADGRCSVAQNGAGRCIPGSFCEVNFTSIGQGQAGWLSFDPRKLRGFEACGADLVFRQTQTTNPQWWPLTIGAYDVATPFSELNVNRIPIDPEGEAIAEDLHTGLVYATFTLVPETEGTTIRVPLQPDALVDLQASVARGDDHFSMGFASIPFEAIGYFSPEDASLDVMVCPP